MSTVSTPKDQLRCVIDDQPDDSSFTIGSPTWSRPLETSKSWASSTAGWTWPAIWRRPS